jgi:hypothetical protein
MNHITIERTQVKQWLEALRDIDALHHPAEPESGDAMKAIADMEQALAQPEQEPVAIVHIKDDCLVGSHRDNSKPFPDGQYGLWPIGTTPPQRPWVEPSFTEWFEWWRVSPAADSTEAEIDFGDFLIIALAVVAKLKEKNG